MGLIFLIACAQPQEYNVVKLDDVCPEQEITECPECIQKECPTCPETKPCDELPNMITLQGMTWGVNALNTRELIYSFGLINYGNEPIDNIEVMCRVNNKNGVQIAKTTTIIPRVAAREIRYGEVDSKNPGLKSEEETREVGFCFIKKCEDCLILDDRIADLVKLKEE